MDAAPQPMKWWFHQHAQGTHFLFESFVIENGVSRFFAYLLIFAICWSERGVTYFLDSQSLRPSGQGRGGMRWKRVGLRTLAYGIATTLRLWYMLITMYFIIDFFIVVILALTSGQLVTEFLKSKRSSSPAYHVPGNGGRDGGILHHRHSSSSSGYTSLEYKDTAQHHIDIVEASPSSGSTDNSNRRSKHREDIEEEQRLFAVPADHEEFELTYNNGRQ